MLQLIAASAEREAALAESEARCALMISFTAVEYSRLAALVAFHARVWETQGSIEDTLPALPGGIHFKLLIYEEVLHLQGL